MNVHEFQAKGILKRYGVAVPQGREVSSPEDAAAAARELGGTCVVKAQIHAGGRGKAGGVKVCHSPAEAEEFARSLLGRTLVTHQTGPGGPRGQTPAGRGGQRHRARILSRRRGRPNDRSDGNDGVIGGGRGDRGGRGAFPGEDPAREPSIPPSVCNPTRRAIWPSASAFPKAVVNKAVSFMTGVYRAFVETDASLIEINPLIIDQDRTRCWPWMPR